MFEVTKDKYEISLWEDELIPAEEQRYEKFSVSGEINLNETYYQQVEDGYEPIPRDKVETFDKDNMYLLVPQKLSFFQERKIAVIGANGHNAPEFAYNPKFIDDVKGEHTLTFTMNSKYYDTETETFVDNPYMKYMVNERKVKLFFRDKWYDLLIKKVEENKKNYAYTFTANDLYINELGKNGVKVELDVELENNQGTAEELAAQILEDTDWQVSSYTDKDEKGNPAEYKSDLLVETNLDTLYKAYLCKDILVKVSADGWLPIREDEVEPEFIPEVDDKATTIIKKGEPIYLFYSDLIAKNPEPMILYRKNEAYQTNTNEDIIINSYNFRVTRENKVTYNDADVPLPDFITYDEYMPINLSNASDTTQYICQANEKTDTIEFVTTIPNGYNGTIYHKQDAGKFGVALEERFRAYETVRRAETGYDPVTDEFVTYFLQRLYTLDYKVTEDEVPYSNKAYFTKTDEGYERFYGYTFDGQEYYELDYREFLKDGKELDSNTQYYVKSKVPEYVPTIDKNPNYYATTQYKRNQTYYYFNPAIRQYVQVRFNDEEDFNSFGKTIYYRENKEYYIYREDLNDYIRYGNLETYIKADQVYCLSVEVEEVEGKNITHIKQLDIPLNLDYFVHDIIRTEVQDHEAIDTDKYNYWTLDSNYVTYTAAQNPTSEYEYEIVPVFAAFNQYIDYYILHEEKIGEDADGNPINNKRYERVNISKFDGKTNYYTRTTPTYYSSPKLDNITDEKEREKYYGYIPVKYPKLVNIMENVTNTNNKEVTQYYIKTISVALPLYKEKFVYEQSGKMIDGYIKYEDSEWSRIKGYIDTEYISPTLVQNFLANSVEMTSLTSGWLFDGSPNDKNRAGELTNRLDDPTRADPDEDTEGSMLILHLTDKPVHYASQTGDYLYTSYDFVVENPMITQEEFWGQNRYFNKEEFDGTYPKVQFTKITPDQVKDYDTATIFRTVKNNQAPYLEEISIEELDFSKSEVSYIRSEITGAGYDWVFVTPETEKMSDKKYNYYAVRNIKVTSIKKGAEYIYPSDNDNNSDWVNSKYDYYVYTGESIYDYYCLSIGEGKYQTASKIYVKVDGNYRRVLKYDDNFTEYYTRKYDGETGKIEFVPINFHESLRYKQGVVYWERVDGKVPAGVTTWESDGIQFKVANVTSKWEFLFYDKPLYVYVPIKENSDVYFLTRDEKAVLGKTYYTFNNGEYTEITVIKADSENIGKNQIKAGSNLQGVNIAYFEKEQVGNDRYQDFYSYVNYDENTPLYRLFPTEDEYLITGKPYYTIDKLDTTDVVTFTSTNQMKFKGGVHKYYTYNPIKDKFEIVPEGQDTPEDGVVYYTFKPTGKMQYIPYDYYKDAWISAATRDYLDMYFHEPGWEAYVPFTAVPYTQIDDTKTYWAKKNNGQFKQLDRYALLNYTGDYVYEKWEEDAIAEVNSLYSFEVESTELTAYAQDLLSLIGEFLDWADYEQESRMEFLNAIDLFGIKRALLLSKLKKLQKKYPDVEKYRREDLLEFLSLLQTEYNQDLRIALSVISDAQAVNFKPTSDPTRKANKKYYYFETKLDSGEVSMTYVPTEYTGESFYSYEINGEMYKIRTNNFSQTKHDLGSLIIYEGEGALLDLINDVNSAIDTVEDSDKEKTLKDIRDQLETIRMESWVSVLNPIKMYKSYKGLVAIRNYIRDGALNPNGVGEDKTRDEEIYKSILDFYQMFITGNNSVDDGIWDALGFISNDAIPYYIQAAFNRAEITQSVNELMQMVNNWLQAYNKGTEKEFKISSAYTGTEIKNMLKDGEYSKIEAYKSSLTTEDNNIPYLYYLETSYETGTKIVNGETIKTITSGIIPAGSKLEEFYYNNEDNNNLSKIDEKAIYYVYIITTLSEYERYDKIRRDLLFASDNGVTYVKVDTETAEPNANTTYYAKEINWQNAHDYVYNSNTRYFQKTSIAGVERYIEVTNLSNNQISFKEDGITIANNDIYFMNGVTYKAINSEVTKWESTEKGPVEYYIKQDTLIDYSKNVTYNTNLQKALNALEDVMSFKFDAYNELVSGNEVFDAVIKELKSFTIIWHLEKSEREQVVAGLQLLIDLAKQLSALQISDRFIDFCLDRRYEGHKRRALNTGFAANRNVIKKLNNGEEYVLAFSLGRYYEGEEPPTYTKTGTVSYGDIENKYYYFDHDPTGIGDFALRTDDYKEIMYGEANYANPYGWMELEGNFELATTDDTIAPLYYCIAQEKTEGKFATRFVRPDSDDLNRAYYYPDDEKGDYIKVKRFDSPFTTEQVYVTQEDYNWLNGEFDKVLLKDGTWKVLYNNKLPWEDQKREAKRFRRSPTYICLKPKVEVGVDSQTVHFGCAPYEQLNPQKFIEITDAERDDGPQEGVQYYTYSDQYSTYNFADTTNGFSEEFKYFYLSVTDKEVQVFKRTTKSSSEGAYKRTKVTSIEGIESDHDFYRIITLSDKVMGPQRDEEYFIYDDQDKTYKAAGELERFDENTDYYIKTYDRRHFSLYNVADDKYPDLYYFVPDDKGDYVHIIRKETVETVDVKWYQFWLREDNMNKIYREFKDGTDDLTGDAPHYFKRYNKKMDYDFHKAAWKDGKFGAWKEKYQRYSKVRVYIYDNTTLDDEYTYWTSNPFSDGSECYTYFNYEETERYTLHKRYRGMENGVHKYWTIDDAIKAVDDKYKTATNHRNVFKATFNPPNNFKNYNYNTGSINYGSANFKIDLGVRMVPVKIATRSITAYENETDSQRVPYVMYKKKDNYKPDAGIDWVYCTNPNESDTGYYRPCTVDDENLYTNWQIAETVDDLLGLYDILKVKDPINWQSDTPPFEYATPIAVSLPAHQFAMHIIKSLNTPYWWGTIKRHYFVAETDAESTKKSKEWFINMVRNFWNWGYKVSFSKKAWCWITNASCADEYTRELEKAQDLTDELKEKIAKGIRDIMKFLDWTDDDSIANAILQAVDGAGIDILSDDPDYIVVDPSKYEPASGVYYIKQKKDGVTYYVLWEPEIKEGEKLDWDPGVTYFTKENAEGSTICEGYFNDHEGNRIGQYRFVEGSDSITYYYYPPQVDKYVNEDTGFYYYTPISSEEQVSEKYFINAYLDKEGGVKKVKPINGNYPVGQFLSVSKLANGKLPEGINVKLQYYKYTCDNTFTTRDSAANRTISARYEFYSAMEAMFGSQWTDWVKRDDFAVGGQIFLGTKDFFTDKILEELYTYTELYVKEVRDGQMKMIPFDDISHGGKDKLYRHTYTGDLRDAADGISEVYYNDGGTYKYYSTKGDYDSRVTLNYDGLKVSFCEYDYEASVFRINPEQTDESFDANLDYDGNHKVYLDFNCSDPIEGYFDLTIAPEIEGIEEGKPDVPAIKERYIWWKAPVQHSYNLTEDLYNRVGTLFYTQNQNIKDYPIIGAQLFKYKAYKSNNVEILLDFKKQFGEYEIRREDTYEPTFEEYRILKKAFQGYFGMDEWNKVESIMDIDYLGKQHNFDTYQSYLHMLCMYLNENGERVEYIKDRIVYNPETGQYSFKFKNRKPNMDNVKISTDAVKLVMSYYEGNKYTSEGEPDWTSAENELVKTITTGLEADEYINNYEMQQSTNDLQLMMANFDQVSLSRFTTYFKNLAYKYSMYQVHKGDKEGKNYYGERPDPNDNYYVVKENEGVYSLEMIDGLSEFPDEEVYRARMLTNLEVQQPTYKYDIFKYITETEDWLKETEDEIPQPKKKYFTAIEEEEGKITYKLQSKLTKFEEGIQYFEEIDDEVMGEEEFNFNLKNGSDYYWLGYNKIDNHDIMFVFDPLAKDKLDDNGNPIYNSITGEVEKEEYYEPNIDYYKKSNGLWTWAEELSQPKGSVKAYISTNDTVPSDDKEYYYYNEDKEKFILLDKKDFVKDIAYEIGMVNNQDEIDKLKDNFIILEYGPHGNVTYYTWDNNLVYYRKDCEYHKQTNDKTDRYQTGRRYYYHKEPVGPEEIDHEFIKTYGQLYPYPNNYEVLTDINEEAFNNLAPQLSKQTKDYVIQSFQQSVDCFVYEPELLYTKYWYPLVDIQSEEQFSKYFTYENDQITGFSDDAPFGIYKTDHRIKQYFKPGTEFYELESVTSEDYNSSILEPSKEIFEVVKDTFELFKGDDRAFQIEKKLNKIFKTKTYNYRKIPREANGYQPYEPFKEVSVSVGNKVPVDGEKYYVWDSEKYDFRLWEKENFEEGYTYYKEKDYYMTEKHTYVGRQELEENYVILAPYAVIDFDKEADISYDENATYWTYTLLKHKGEYDTSKEYYKQVYTSKPLEFLKATEIEPIKGINYYTLKDGKYQLFEGEAFGENTVYYKHEIYDSDTIYLKPIKDQYIYTREVSVEAKLLSLKMSKAVRANLRVTFQLLDGVDAIWPFEPETYENVLLYPNANEGYLARLIEEEAYKLRKDNDKLYERALNPNPFKAFVCDGVESNLVGVDYLVEGETYEAVVTLDTRTLAGHHNIAEDYDPNDLHWLASLNYKASEWWDQEMARQAAHRKKAAQSWNDFWNGLFGDVEEGPENSGGLPANTGLSGYNDDDENVVIKNGEVREPNILTILFDKKIEQGWFVDWTEQADATIEDFFTEEPPEAFNKIQTEATEKYQEFKKEIKEEISEAKTKMTEIVDQVAEDIVEINSTIANGVTKVVDDISNGIKSACAYVGKLFKVKGWFSVENNANLGADGLTDKQYSHYLDIINNNAQVNTSINDRLTSELQRSLILSTIDGSNPMDASGMAEYAGQLGDYLFEVATFVRYIQQLGYYDFLRDGNYLANTEDFYSTFEEKYSTPEFINRVLSETYKELITSKYIMALPGEVPDNDDLIISNYYLYDSSKEGADDIDTLVYDYVGNDALDYYIYDYDDLCQKVRSITAKEKNYLSIIQSINEKFECWSKFELAHYTEEENAKLSVPEYDKAHTPGEVKMIERVVWVAEDDETDIVFEPLNIPNSHISDKQNKEISALTQFNPKDYWEARKDYKEWNGHRFEDGIDYYEENQTGKFIKVNREQTPIPDGQVIYYIKINDVNLDKVEKVEDKTYYRKIQMVPDKKLFLKQFTGDLNFAGFKYGINLKSIKRTLDSKELVSRLIVKENTNEHAIDGFCTIQRAAENPIKESFILNFDYYIQHQMLKRNELWRDLYDLKDGYYCQLAAINKDLDWLANEIAEVNECLDRINAKYETYSLARDAAQEEIENMATILSEYMPEGVPSPWKYNMSKETEVLRTAWSDTKTKEFTTKDKDGNIIEMTEHVVQGQSRAIEIPKYGEDAQKNIEQMDLFQKNYTKYQGLAEKAREQKKHYEDLLKELYEKSDNMVRMKNNLNLLFFKKYYRFIQEGTWKKDDYMDDTLYYLDALAVARTSAFPKVTYDIQTVDLYNLNDYKGYSFGIGDKTYIEDTEFFGYTDTGKPYQEETIVTKLEYVLDEPSKNKITLTNYKTQFEDLFQRIAAAVSKVELQTGGYNMANAAINGTSLGAPGQGEIFSLPGTIEMVNGTVEIGKSGIITTEVGSTSNKLKFVNGALYRTIDGGETYQRIISAESGINPAMIGGGKLDITSLVIGSKDKPELSLTSNGLTAFRKDGKKIDYSTLVRFDSYGIYGIKDYKRNSSTDDASNATLNDAFIPTDINSIYENGSFGLTWDGFFLNTGDNTGRVSIGTENDLRMSTRNSHGKWDDRIVIGKLTDEEETYYGFRIIDDRQNIVLNTDDRGQLYLRHKLHISHFNDEVASVNPELVKYIQVIPTPEDKEYYVYDENNKIFVKAEREYGYIFDAKETYYILEENEYIPVENPPSDLEAEYYTKTIVKEENEDKEVYVKFDKVLVNDPDVIYYEKQKITTDKKLDQTNVTLGIVKAYKRTENGYETGKEIHDNYSSLDYLTKILSVKSAVDGYDLKGALKDKKDYFKQFSVEQLATLIEPNENLAIFDNGNLYAKNAWIEGHIRATSGTFTGTIEAEAGYIGGIKIEQFGLSSGTENGNNWQILADGTGRFSNVEVSGTISAAVFSYDKIQSVGGAMLVRPSYKVLRQWFSEDKTKLYLELDAPSSNVSLPGFEVGSYCRFGHDFGEFNSSDFSVKMVHQIYGYEIREGKTVCNIIVIDLGDETTGSKYEDINIESVISVKQSGKTTYGLGLNSTDKTNIMPSQSFSLVEMDVKEGNLTYTPKIILGKLPDNLPSRDSLIADEYDQYYGLYADNVLLRGSLTTVHETDSVTYSAGVSTNSTHKIKDVGVDRELIFWSGLSNEEKELTPNFYVDRTGYLYAQNGRFEGEVVSSIIRTSTIMGNKEDGAYGLTIVPDDGDGSSKAILFAEKEGGNTYFSLDSSKLNSSIDFIVEAKVDQTQGTITSDVVKYNFGVLNGSNSNAADIKNCVGLFGLGEGSQPSEYLLNFTLGEDKKINLNYGDTMIATIDGAGIHANNSDNSWGEAVYLEGLTYGCDIYVR